MSAARKAAKLAEAHAVSAHRVEDLASKAKALEGFDDPADAGKVLAARAAVEAAKAERDVLAVALEAAEKAHAAAVAEEAVRQAAARKARLLAEAAAVGKDLLAALVNVCTLAGRNAALGDQLGTDSFKFWIGDFAASASKTACTAVRPKTIKTTNLRGDPVEIIANAGTRSIDLRLVVPIL
jgi:hypothetical protein